MPSTAGHQADPASPSWTTHAITIEAQAPEVWPWLVQMGWGRAGWHTYRWVNSWRAASKPS